MNEDISTQVLKVDEAGRVQTPREKRAEIVAAYESTSMTGRQFAAYCGVKYSTLMCWVKRYRTKKPPAGRQMRLGRKWVEAVVEEQQAAEELHVEIGTGVRLRVSSLRQAALAAEILRVMEVAGRC
jgi:transposase-like protein